MALTNVSTGGTIQASDINQLVNTLQKQSGQNESGKYYLGAAAYANASLISIYMRTHSQGVTPVSSFIDDADSAHTNMNAPAVNNLTSYGFQIYSFSTGVTVNAHGAGNWTIGY